MNDRTTAAGPAVPTQQPPPVPLPFPGSPTATYNATGPWLRPGPVQLIAFAIIAVPLIVILLIGSQVQSGSSGGSQSAPVPARVVTAVWQP